MWITSFSKLSLSFIDMVIMSFRRMISIVCVTSCIWMAEKSAFEKEWIGSRCLDINQDLFDFCWNCSGWHWLYNYVVEFGWLAFTFDKIRSIGSINQLALCLLGSDNHLELDAQVGLHNKKRSPCKRIIGFQVVILTLLMVPSFWFFLLIIPYKAQLSLIMCSLLSVLSSRL